MKYIKCIFTLLLLLNITAKADELPDLGERSETYITSKEEKRLGKEFIKEVRLNIPILNDAIINDYIQNLGNKLSTHANTKRKKFNFFIVNDPTINAFAGPDAYVGINSGTITSANSESELAAVMAHEIAHITQHHIERLINSARNTQVAAMAGILVAAIVGANSNSRSMGDLASGATMASIGGATQHMINFTREHEIEADNIGMKILYQSSFDPNAMPTFFERTQRMQYNYTDETPRLLMTHPVTTDRIAEAKNRADQYKIKNIKPQNTFGLIQARTQVLTSNNLTNTTKHFRIKLSSQTQQDFAIAQYGYALALYKSQQLELATNIISNLQNKYPQEVLFQMLAAQIATANKQDDSAINILKNSLLNHKNYYPLIIQYTETLIAAKRFQAACDFIKNKIWQYPEDADLYKLLAQAYAQNNQKADALQAKAKAYAIDGYNRQAIVLLQQALKMPKLSTNDRAIINARIDQLKQVEKTY